MKAESCVLTGSQPLTLVMHLHLCKILHHIEDVALVCKGNLTSTFRVFAHHLPQHLPRFVLTLHRCKRIGDVGAQQLLLDTYGIKTLFLGLRSLGEEDIFSGSVWILTQNGVEGNFKAESLESKFHCGEFHCVCLLIYEYSHHSSDAFLLNLPLLKFVL